MEESKSDGSIPFLDTIITPQADGTFTTGVYRNPNNTYLYLPWDSHHNLAAKYSVISTLTHRAKTICFTPQLLESELKHLEEVLMLCKYPKWAINKILHKQEEQKKSAKMRQIPTSKQSKKKCHIGNTILQGICESFKSICDKYEVIVHFKEGQTLKNILFSSKHKDTITKKNGVIYWFRYDKNDCDEEYIWESSRTFGERYKENLKAPSPILIIRITLATYQQWRTLKP